MANYKFFQNTACEYFPCHNSKEINCLFCFCPLYYLECGGDFIILQNGIKDCSNCLIPHTPEGYDYIIERIKEHGRISRDLRKW